MLRTAVPTLLSVLSTLLYTSAAPNSIFAGCVNANAPVASAYTYDKSSAEECAASCYSSFIPPFTYSAFIAEFYTPEEVPQENAPERRRKRAIEQTCICSNEPPAATSYVRAATSDGSGSCDPEDAAIYITDSSYDFLQCVPNGQLWSSFPPDAVTPGQVASPEACLAFCKPYEIAAFQPDAIKESYNCFCGSETTYQLENTGACGQYAYFPYFHTANTAVSSQFAKRQMKEKLLRLQGDKQALCPNALTACKVGGVVDSFECIDTTSELESCGGCYSGNFNANETSFGVDCTQLIGVAPGAVTCNQGKCQSFKCLPEFTLAANGTCISA